MSHASVKHAHVKHPPQIPSKAHITRHHGIARNDEYHWLEAQNWQEVLRKPSALAPAIRKVLDAENRYCDAVLQPAAGLRQKLFQEMRARVPLAERGVPRLYGDYAWQTRFARGAEHASVYRLARARAYVPRARGRKILDGNAEARGRKNFRLAATLPSPDQQHLAWAADAQGTEFFTIRVRDCARGRDARDRLQHCATDMAWSACGKYLFYIALNRLHRPEKVMRHRLGSTQASDICVYRERDAGFFVSLSPLRAGRHIAIVAHTHETSEIRTLDATKPLARAQLIAPRRQGVEWTVDDDAARERFILRTNLRGAQDFCLMSAPWARPQQRRMLVPHKAGRLILQHAVFAKHLVWLFREKAQTQLATLTFANKQQRNLRFHTAPHALDLDEGYEYDTPHCRLVYSSLSEPRQIWDYDLARRRRIVRHKQKLRTPHNANDYRSRRIFARAPDGARVPISLVWHKTTKPSATTPLWLYAYGAYGLTIEPSFSAARLSLLRRGVVYAIAHVRGGRAQGQQWFLDGRGAKKQNTFTDCIAAARALVRARYTSARRIVLHGGSAGGLLVGACLNRAPAIFGAAVAEVPFVDVLTTMLNASLPLTPPEWPEWGNPITSKRAYQQIAAYAPYENVRAAAYPPVLATAGLSDPRVTYWEAAKWVARLRAASPAPALLKIKMDAGHSGAAGRFKALRDTAFVYSFALHALKK